MQEITDFLSFKTFISSYMLFVFYYLGAVVVPMIAYIFAKKIYKYPKETIKNTLPLDYKIKIAVFSIILFIFMEILWRMMFEFLLAFLQMRDALVL
jgi:hypothetical protein